jgi:hypothetical protein
MSCLRRVYCGYFLWTACLCLACGASAAADANERQNISGTVVNAKTKEPVAYASVTLDGGARWTVTNEQGEFVLKNVPQGEAVLTVSCLGYVRQTVTVRVGAGMPALKVALPEDNLLLDEVQITAQKSQDDMTTSYVIDQTGLAHLQMIEVADAMSLLPGGQTNRNLHLATGSAQYLMLRSASGEAGNPSFATAVEVDGVRLSSNAVFHASSTMTSIYGVDTRSIASNNIASIEVVTGIPSVEYGDLSNGLVKIKSMKGKSPLNVALLTKPNTKQVSVNKGFDLGRDAGVLNVSFERTRSVSDLASPYTSYDRNVLSLRYANTFNRNLRPLTFEAGFSGNVGGYNSEGDPDRFVETYTKVRGNTLRADISLQWQLDRAWLTDLEASAAINYSDNLQEDKSNKSNSTSAPALHGTDEGYFVAARYDDNPAADIVLLPTGYWYQLRYIDSKPLSVTANLKAKWARAFGAIKHNAMLGADYSATGNKGRGMYYDDLRYAPTWREYRYDRAPFMHNAAAYAEEKMSLSLGKSVLQLMAGVRADMTMVSRSAYGTVGSLSPRFNAKYTWAGDAAFVRRLTVRAGWGKAVKLPSFEVLYPRPDYTDELAFAPGAMADGTTFYAYHVTPHTPAADPNLRWQYSRQWELGIEAQVRGVSVSLSFFHHQTVNPYRFVNLYVPFTYKFTGQAALEQSAIPSVNRIYAIDRTTGIVTVTDRTGTHAPEVLAYTEREDFKRAEMITNGTPFIRRGLEWVVDFGKIPLLQTAVRLDGKYYHYRSVDETIMPHVPSSQYMADGKPYKYVGYYVGEAGISNGKEKKQLNTNVTLTTHIPAVRLILSFRVESTLYNYELNLSEYSNGMRGFAVNDRSDNFPANDPTRYNSNRYVVVYPLYYTSADDMQTRIPFAEKLAWAADNDRALYNELVKLVQRSNTDYFFNANRLSAYYSINLGVTKELGNLATLSFSATNFTNNAQQVTQSDTGAQTSVYNHGRKLIPQFYYSLSLKIKL